MARLYSDRWADEAPVVLLVGRSDESAATAAALEYEGSRVLYARDSREALDLIEDMAFLELPLHGLLGSVELPDADGLRVVRAFRSRFPDAPAALWSGRPDLALTLWARSRGVTLFEAPPEAEVLQRWLNSPARAA
ncbi:MAG: hypothetical protein AMXMBFR7_03520 [Planctomycetota bacterium]